MFYILFVIFYITQYLIMKKQLILIGFGIVKADLGIEFVLILFVEFSMFEFSMSGVCSTCYISFMNLSSSLYLLRYHHFRFIIDCRRYIVR